MACLNVLGSFLLLCLVSTLTPNDFKPALFHSSQPSGFYNVDTGTPNDGEILAFADLNGDKYTDYLATSSRSSSLITAYYWNDPSATFATNQLTLTNPNSGSLAEIMICDLNADGLNQLVVTYTSSGSYYSQIYQTVCGSTCSINLWQIDYNSTGLSSMDAVPFIFDRFGNGTVHLFTFQGGERRILTAPLNQQQIYEQDWSQMVTSSLGIFYPVSQHFASLIDVNGDCFSDIVIVDDNNTIEFYIKNSQNSYDYSFTTLNKNITWLTFADFDANGATDILLVSYQQNAYVPYILPNVNTPSDICVAYPASSFNAQNLIAISFPSTYILLQDTNLKVGDFNFDGYPDLLGIFSINSYRSTSILVNQQQFQFAPFDSNLSELQQINNPLQACLFDFTENGQLDIIIISQATKNDGTIGFPRTSIINNIISDALFIKIIPLLPSSSDDLDSSVLVNAVGVSIEWRITNLDGDKTISVLNQKFQWNYGSLLLPFATAGLGRTNNYIQDLTVGYPGYGMEQAWTPVIPNSQLVVLGQLNSDWVLQTLLKDNNRVYDVIYISILCLFGMGLLIVFLNWKQNQQDKRDHYNFIQMIH